MYLLLNVPRMPSVDLYNLYWAHLKDFLVCKEELILFRTRGGVARPFVLAENETVKIICKNFTIGTSVRRSSRSAFGRPTGNDVSGHYKRHYFLYFFFLFFFPVVHFSHRRSARGVDPFPDPVGHFEAPWRPFWILQAVRRCRRLASAPFAARLVFVQR